MSDALSQSLPMLLVKITLILLLACAVSLALRRASAAGRSAVWAAAILGTLVLPLLSLTTPAWRITPPPSFANAASFVTAPVTNSDVSVAHAPGSPLEKTADVLVAGPASHAAPRQAPIDWRMMACAVWLMGVFTMLARLFLGLRRVGRALILSRALNARETLLAADARAQMHVRRTVTIRRASLGSGVVAPITWGAIHPIVLLPAQSTDWTDDCIRAALLHELAHIRRWDWPMRIAANLAFALYWWHPLVWIAARQARETSERACDDCVLNVGVPPADYAQRLVDVLRSMPKGAKPLGAAAIAMALPNETEQRIHALLASGINRQGVTRKWTACVIVSALVFILPAGALHLAQNANDEVLYVSGGKISLVGICNPTNGRQWWTVTGARIPVSEMPVTLTSRPKLQLVSGLGKRIPQRTLIFQTLGIPRDASLKIKVAGEDVALQISEPQLGSMRTIEFVTELAVNERDTTIRVGMAGEHWKSIALITPAERLTKKNWGSSTISFDTPSRITLSDTASVTAGSIDVTLRGPIVDDEIRVFAVDRRGVAHLGTSPGAALLPRVDNLSSYLSGSTEATGEALLGMKFQGLQSSDTQKYIIQARPYEWREFQNVSLDPS